MKSRRAPQPPRCTAYFFPSPSFAAAFFAIFSCSALASLRAAEGGGSLSGGGEEKPALCERCASCWTGVLAQQSVVPLRPRPERLRRERVRQAPSALPCSPLRAAAGPVLRAPPGATGLAGLQERCAAATARLPQLPALADSPAAPLPPLRGGQAVVVLLVQPRLLLPLLGASPVNIALVAAGLRQGGAGRGCGDRSGWELGPGCRSRALTIASGRFWLAWPPLPQTAPGASGRSKEKAKGLATWMHRVPGVACGSAREPCCALLPPCSTLAERPSTASPPPAEGRLELVPLCRTSVHDCLDCQPTASPPGRPSARQDDRGGRGGCLSRRTGAEARPHGGV